MNRDKQNLEVWSKVIEKDIMLYPSERVVAFMARNYSCEKLEGDYKGLDIGFGSGRHLKVLLDYNFEAHGIDYSVQSVSVAKELFGNAINVKQSNMNDIEYDREFNVVIMYGVAFLRTVKEMIADFKRVNRFMKPGGRLLVNFRTKDDFLYGKGEEIENNSFVLNTNNTYKGLLYTFLDKDEAVNILKEAGLEVELVEREDYWKNNLQEQHSWWVITARKKG